MKILLTFCLIIVITSPAGTDAVTTVTGYRGRSVQIQCSYKSGDEDNIKYLCRGKCPLTGYKDIPVKSGSPAKDTRFSLYDDTTAKVFTVNITDLRTKDGGTYWCAIERKFKDTYTEVRLQVKAGGPAISTASASTHTTHSASTCSTSPPAHAEITHSTTGTPPNHSSSAPPSQDFPASTVITAVSVVLVLLLIALIFAVALQRKKKTRASSPAKSRQSSSNNHVAPLPVGDYKIKDSRCLPNTLYSTVQIPTSPLATPQTVYSNTELPTAPFDSPQTIYTAVRHPAESPDQDVYATPHLPTILSDSSVSAVVKSDEGPTYAEVSFHTRSNGAAPPVRYRNESSSCDYATVKVTGSG